MLNVNDQKILNERMNSLLFDSFLDSSTNGNETNSFESSSPPPPLPPPLSQQQIEKQTNSQSNLEFVDFIEVNNDLYNIDQECAWLVDPKLNKLQVSKHQQQLMKQQIKNEEPNSPININSNNNHNNKTNNINNPNHKIKNPYKWIMEEFEDKNLDNVKRTLLVALDDISKGFNRRSRSVSTTRTPYFNQNNHHHHPQNYQNNNNNNNYFMHQHQNQQEADLLFNGLNDLKKQQATVQQSKSTESILNDSATTDTIDANNTVEIIPTDSKKSQISNKNSYSSATLVKKKAINNNNNRNLNLLIQHDDPSAHLSTIESIDINNDNENNDNLDQYEDILDVQVIAKMQEETLRQSVLNINKGENKRQTEFVQPTRSYSTATIVKRTHQSRPSIPTSANFEYENSQMRRDSASMSDHSSLSSTASNNASPYASHVNVNVGFNNNNVIKPVKRNETILVSQSLMQNKRNDINGNNNYQTITKNSAHKMLNFTGNSANMINNKSSLNSHSRSTTPSSKQPNQLTSSNSNILKHDSRLPTPRSRETGPLNSIVINNSLTKPPPSPLQVTGRVGRTPMAYGGQRSATTSIVPMIGSNSSAAVITNNNNTTTNWQQSKFNKLQKQQPILTKQPQQQQQQQRQQQPALSRTSTNHSISSSHSSNNLTPNSSNPNSTLSPSSSSSVSTSSSMHQITSMNNLSSPKSRQPSPSPQTNNNNNNNNKIVISPSGLLTDGPLGRYTIANRQLMRDRSSSPVYENGAKQKSVQPTTLQNQLNIANSNNLSSSNSSLHTIQESKIPTSSPMLIKKQLIRKSFLPQPVQSTVNQINTDSNWKDGCY